MTNTVETITLDAHPDYRARIVNDTDPIEPEDEGGSPILVMTYRDIYHVKGRGDYSGSAAVEAAADYWHQRGDFDKLERYLKIFHGATDVVTYDTNGDKFVSYDAAEWRERVGAPVKGAEGLGADYTPADMSEYVAYVEGYCYGIVVEKLATWVKADDPDETRDDWEEVDSLWGFYGDVDGYVTEEAKSMLESAVSN